MGIWLQAVEAGGRVGSQLGASVFQTGLTLVGVCLVSWCVLLLWSRRRQGSGAEERSLHVVSRLDLDARRRLLVVAVGERRLLVGLGESGPPRLLTELFPSLDALDLGVAEDEAAGENLPTITTHEEHQLEGQGDGLGAHPLEG